MNIDYDLIAECKKEANIAISSASPNLRASFAGMSFSSDGQSKIISILDDYFSNITEKTIELPEKFTINISPELLSEIDSLCTFYLFLDQFRPSLGIKILPRSRALKKEFHETMDGRAMIAALRINQVRSFLR
jgi:hypothetical protein